MPPAEAGFAINKPPRLPAGDTAYAGLFYDVRLAVGPRLCQHDSGTRPHTSSMKNIVTIRRIILSVGIAVLLWELLLPSLRSPSHYYTEPQMEKQQLEAVHIPRTAFGRPHLARLEHGVVVRTEVDGGELLRELAFLVLLFGAAYLWSPKILAATLSVPKDPTSNDA